MDNQQFDECYEAMTDGQKQHMTNRIYKYDGLIPQGLRLSAAASEDTYGPGAKFVDANGRKWLLCICALDSSQKMGLVNLQTGYLYVKATAVRNRLKVTVGELRAMGPEALWVESPTKDGTIARRVY